MATHTTPKTPVIGKRLTGPLGKGRFWHPSAPKVVRRAFQAGEEAEGWTAWTDYLRQRHRPLPLAELLPSQASPLLWALPEQLAEGPLATLLTQLARVDRGPRADRSWLAEALARWVKPAANGRLTVAVALEALAWCHALVPLAALVERDAWLALLQKLEGLARDAQSLALEEDPLAHQLLAGELGLTLAGLFPEISACQSLAKPSRASLSAGLKNLLERQGLPRGPYLGLVRPLAACWTRSRVLGSALPDGCWNSLAEKRYQRFLRQVLRLARPDGSHAFAPHATAHAATGWLEPALRLVGSEEDADLAALVFPGRKRAGGRIRKLALPEAAAHSEQAALAVLRRGWDRQDPRLTVDYHGPSVRLELCCGPEVFWSGAWEVEVIQDGRPLSLTSAWEEICWYSDEQIDYIELEARFSGDVRVQRHLALAREDDFLLLADSVHGGRPATLQYGSRLPLGEGVVFEPAEESHEGFLRGARRRALVLPLALPEWRADPRPGGLAATKKGLQLHQVADGSALFAPLLVDFDPRRIRRPYTWRQLTVAENLQALAPDAAVGYRAMVGPQQWLLYRSLAAPGNRSVLGHNLITQMLLARFDSDGEVESLVEIE